MEKPKKPSQQDCTNIILSILCFAMMCLSCFNTFSQEKLSGALEKLQSKVGMIERDIYEGSTRSLKKNSRKTDVFYKKTVKTDANEFKESDSDIFERLQKRLHNCEVVSRQNRFATREIRNKLNGLKANLRSAETLSKLFGNESVLAKARDKRSAGQNEKSKNIPSKLCLPYVPVNLAITENKNLGTILTLRGPPGEKGQSGARGQRGKAGPRGFKGERGELGMKGDFGPRGHSGVKGEKGEKGNCCATIAVPKIIVPPANQTVLSPDEATFTCEATGNPKPEISLIPKGKRKNSRYKTFGEGNLSINNVTFEDRGVIECVAKSILGEDRRAAHLIVNVKAKATIKNKVTRTEQGFDVSINCDVKGFPEPIVSWKRPGKNLPSRTTFSNNNNRMQLVGVTSDDGGDYICQAVNAHATSLATASVVVVERLAFIVKPDTQRLVNAFSNFKIPCAYIGGLPPVKVTWQKDGKELQVKAIISHDSRTLEIKNANRKDMGKYSCQVRSKMSSISLSVDVSPSNSYLPTCDILKQKGVTKSGIYQINPSGDPFEKALDVFCEMGSQVGVTVLSHDSEARTRVDGLENNGAYRKRVKYVSASDRQIKALMRISRKCEQHIKYECTGSVLWLHKKNPFAWWVSFSGRKMQNWGGVAYPNRGCACTLTKSCPSAGTCMCDTNGGTSTDEGYLRDKEFLPVKELRFGDTGDKSEVGYHTLGKLKCS